MRLNLLNQTVIVAAAISQAELSNLNPRFGSAHPVNDKSFKFAAAGDALNAVLVERLDLGEFFDKIPQDITGFTFETSITGFETLSDKIKVDQLTQEYPVDNLSFDEAGPEDVLGVFFVQWKRVVGLSDLKRSEVELSSSDDYMTVDARNALLYKGSVQVKIK